MARIRRYCAAIAASFALLAGVLPLRASAQGHPTPGRTSTTARCSLSIPACTRLPLGGRPSMRRVGMPSPAVPTARWKNSVGRERQAAADDLDFGRV